MRSPSSYPILSRLLRDPEQRCAVLYWVVPAAAIVLVVLVLWTGATGDRATVGGDDSHLYFVDPWRFLSHAPLTTLDNNLGGYNPRVFMVPFLVLLAGIDSLGLNVTGVTLGIAAALTFAGVARLTMELLAGPDHRARAAGLVAGTLVLCAPILAQTQGTHLLLGIYWAPLLPWLVLFVLWHQRTGHLRWVAMAALATAVGAPAMNQLPWTMTCLLLIFAIGVVVLASGLWKPRPRRLALLLGLTIAVNGFWIVPVSQIGRQGQAQLGTALSEGGRSDALLVVRALIPLQRPLDTLSLRGSTRQFDAYEAPQAVPNRWPRRLWLLGLMPLALMGVATARVFPKLMRADGERRRNMVLPLLLVVLIIFAFVMSPGLVPFGPEVFEWLTTNVPGWTAVRNFFDKFAIPYTLAFALACGSAFFLMTERVRRPMVALGTAASVVGIALYGLPAVRGDYFRLPYTLSSPENRVMSGLPRSYLHLLGALRRRPPGAVLTLPLSTPAWSSFSKRGSRGVYIGISPIYWLTGRPDYNGLDSFTSAVVPELRARVSTHLAAGRFDEFAELVGQLGIRYLVINLQPPVARWHLRISALPDTAREAAATRSVVAALGARPIARYGDHELLEIAPSRRRELVSIEPGKGPRTGSAAARSRSHAPGGQQTCPTGSVRRTSRPSPTTYVAHLRPFRGPCTLILAEAFSRGWKATLTGADGRSSLGRPRKVHGFANGFDVGARAMPTKAVFTYEPQRLLHQGALVSAGGGATLLCVALLNRRRRRSPSVGMPED